MGALDVQQRGGSGIVSYGMAYREERSRENTRRRNFRVDEERGLLEVKQPGCRPEVYEVKSGDGTKAITIRRVDDEDG